MMIDQSTAPPSIIMMMATLTDIVDTTTDTRHAGHQYG